MILAATGRVSKNNQASESKFKTLTSAQAPDFRQVSGLLHDPGGHRIRTTQAERAAKP